MIFVNSPLMQDKIIDLLNNYNEDGVTFEFVEKQGMKLRFKTSSDDPEAAAKLAKSAIKGQDWGTAIFFQAAAE
ncbi:hypothetical protein RA086_13555 [Lactiplantibacillus sp. WILCCON 0030]|uniref:Uncharacterized protein n=1 Tax=Lactiplantibacillus brownii TaxID=3069269 RepID=A0ABU1ACH9_9LACO|nr:hypothetical protein [Lactiplantibacillus brownii]MDQ7938635.1 hypothetical protein [Lactiplantibacillus brownii]